MDGFGSVQREHVSRGEGRKSLDELNQFGAGNRLLQNDGNQKLAFGEIGLRGKAESALEYGSRDVLNARRGGLHEPVPVLAEERPSPIGQLAEKRDRVGVVGADALLAVRSVQTQTERSLQPEPAKPERRHVPIQNRAQNQLRGGACAEIGLAAGGVAVGIHGRRAEERAEGLAGSGAVVVVPVRVTGEMGEVELGDGADLVLHELGEEGVEVGDRAEVGVRDSGVNHARMV